MTSIAGRVWGALLMFYTALALQVLLYKISSGKPWATWPRQDILLMAVTSSLAAHRLFRVARKRAS